MSQFAQLIAGGYVGVPARPPFLFNLTEKKLFDAAKKRGKFRNLVALRGFEQFQETGNDPDAAIILKYSLVWPLLWNLTTQYTGSAVAFAESAPNQFGGNKYGISYYRRKLNTPALLSSKFALLPNHPLAFRAFLFNPEKEVDYTKVQPRTRFRVRFGGGAMRWQLTISDGSFELARLSDKWSEAQQGALDALEDKEMLTLAETDQASEIRGPIRREAGGIYSENAIFESVDNLSLGAPAEHQLGKFYEITIIPEPRGRMNLILSGAKAQFVEVPQVLAGGVSEVVSGAGPVQVWTSGAPYLFQMGRPSFEIKGELLTGPFRKTGNTLNDFISKTSGDSGHLNAAGEPFNATLPGTDLSTIARGLKTADGVNEADWFEFVTTLTTSDNRFTPFLYALQTRYPAQPRPYSNAVVWNSNDHLDSAGNPPILNIEWNCDAANRRSSAVVTLRDVSGTTFNSLPGGGIPALENRLVSLKYGPTLGGQTPLLGRALVTKAQLSNMASANANLSRFLATMPGTQIVLDISDAWALLDEILAIALELDGMRLGKAIRTVLFNAGFSEVELAGISETFGRILPRAALGQRDCILPSQGQTVGEFVRQLLDRWGMGAGLVHDENGVWQLGNRSTSLRSVTIYESGFADPSDPNSGTFESQKTVNLEFSSSAARNNNRTYPGRLAILSPLDLSRDFDDFFNDFIIVGAFDPLTGQRFSTRQTLEESVHDENSLNHLGRLKTMVVYDDGIRNEDDLEWVKRSLIERYGQPGRFATFETYFHPFLYPDDRILIDGATWILKRLEGGSLARDRMNVTAQQLTA